MTMTAVFQGDIRPLRSLLLAAAESNQPGERQFGGEFRGYCLLNYLLFN